MFQSIVRTCLVSTALAFVSTQAAARGDDPMVVAHLIQVADDASELLKIIEDDAWMLAQGAYQIGDTAGYLRYVDAKNAAHSADFFAYESYSRDLGNGQLLSNVAGSVSRNKSYLSQLNLAIARLRNPPMSVLGYYASFQDLDREFQQVLADATRRPPPPDVPGLWECSSTFSPGGIWMNFRARGNPRSAAQRAAMDQCLAYGNEDTCYAGTCTPVTTPPRRR